MTRRLRFVLIGSGVLLSLCGVGGYAVSRTYLDFPWAARELEAAVKEYRSLGLPWEAKDLEPQPPLGPDENAAPLLKAVFDALQPTPSTEPPALGAVSDALRDGATAKERQAALAPFRPLFKDIERALEKSRLSLKHDWDEGFDTAFPELAAGRSVVELLVTRAATKRDAGDFDGAAEDLMKAQKLGRMLGQDPTLLAGLTSLACEALVLREVERLIEVSQKDPQGLIAANRVLASPLPPDYLMHHLRGEMYSGVAYTRNLDRLGGWRAEFGVLSEEPVEDSRQSIVRTGLPSGTIARGLLARYLQGWNAIFRDWKPGEDPMSIAKRANALMQRDEAERRMSFHWNPLWLSTVVEAAPVYVRSETYRRCLQGLSRVVAYRSRTGRWPATLADADFNGIDPFDGKPLRMVVKGDQVRVYSVGPDGIDDGGVTSNEPRAGGHDEVAIFSSSIRGTFPGRR